MRLFHVDRQPMDINKGIIWDVTLVPLVRTDVSEEVSAPIFRVTRIFN
jgi:membrane protein YdbS with pleckstrin-like domain